jgi:hypothetical protein
MIRKKKYDNIEFEKYNESMRARRTPRSNSNKCKFDKYNPYTRGGDRADRRTPYRKRNNCEFDRIQ